MQVWPVLSYPDGKNTYETLHLWTQILGKIKLAKLPWVNHSWHVTLQVTPTGLSTSDLPDENDHFQIDLDLLKHQLIITTASGQTQNFDLGNHSVATFYHQIMEILHRMGVRVKIHPRPCEIPNAINFYEDTVHATYEPEHVQALHQALLKVQAVFTRFRAEFIGKCSPVHFFWGSFDLAVTRFSGQTAPLHPGGVPNLPDRVAREAYSHEVSSCGFWPGNYLLPFAAFYSYIYPEPEGFKTAQVKPKEAYYHKELGEFILPYDQVQQSSDPEKTLLSFLHSTYDAASTLASWDRDNLLATYKPD